MRLTVVGCSGSAAGPASAASCYLVQAEDPDRRTWNVVLDLGAGAFGPLQRYVDPARIDAVCLSHLHADHCADLVGLAVWLKYAPGGPFAPVTVYGPAATQGRIAQLTDASGGGGARSGRDAGGTEAVVAGGGAFAVRRWRCGEEVRVGPFRITPYPAAHPVEAYALRIAAPGDAADAGAILAYTGDGDLGPGVARAAAGADLVLGEAGFVAGRDRARGVHMTGEEVGTLAASAGARGLLLTHIAPWDSPAAALAAAGSAYGGPVHLAQPGAVHRL